jgi:hypothetical protein
MLQQKFQNLMDRREEVVLSLVVLLVPMMTTATFVY